MERIAIISDIHGNITALNTVLQDIKSREIKRIIALGDYVMKCANPDLVIDTVRKECEINLIGNGDYAIARPEIKDKKYWTREKIGEERAEWLYKLPRMHEFYLSGHLVRLFHASPESLDKIYNPMFKNEELPKEWTHEIPQELFKNTKFIGKNEDDKVPDIVGYGHLHTPFIVRFGNKMLFNPGSVGIPIEMLNHEKKDEKNKFSTMASYIILEGEYNSNELGNISLQLVRLTYDIEKEIKYLENSDMPNKELIIHNLKTAISTL